ncbi:hypothetical protein SAMN05428988_6560 [Chitinophaga sp. YR573]|uniref:hypothetical protein n=1 Tax=Chitinophaga sp. YR573 TaxID=1881040 RepID=UPI0008B07101|nr:hypothetical protein [Chitinophaga sp. YR573]SEW46851.1 hypothetical protein SAMN05428988_6560 [Chitinophaga sp. YR573]
MHLINQLSKILRRINKPVFILPVLIVFAYVITVKDCNKRGRLISNFSIADGIVKHFSTNSRSANGIDYTFEINGKLYTSSDAYPNINGQIGADFTGHHFPVAYQIGDTGNNTMLIAPANFKRFHIAFPDSLSWVIKYLDLE